MPDQDAKNPPAIEVTPEMVEAGIHYCEHSTGLFEGQYVPDSQFRLFVAGLFSVMTLAHGQRVD